MFNCCTFIVYAYLLSRKSDHSLLANTQNDCVFLAGITILAVLNTVLVMLFIAHVLGAEFFFLQIKV